MVVVPAVVVVVVFAVVVFSLLRLCCCSSRRCYNFPLAAVLIVINSKTMANEQLSLLKKISKWL